MVHLSKKVWYNLEILYNKWSPFIISALLIIYHTLKFLIPVDLTWMLFICLPSAFTILHMYNSRQTFMLCKVHRCFVNYVVGNWIACLIEHYWINPYMNIYWFTFVTVGTMTALLMGLIYYTEEHGENDRRLAKKNSR